MSTYPSFCVLVEKSIKSIKFLLQVYKSHFSNNVNANNLAGLVEQYIWRTDISLTRDITEKNTLSCPVLNLVGIHAANAIIDETVTFNGRLTPTKANWIKIQVS